MGSFIKYFLLLVGFFSILESAAQVPVIQLQRDSILIGEQFGVVLQIAYPADGRSIDIQWPGVEDQFGDFLEVLDSTKVDTVSVTENDRNFMIQNKAFVVTSFDSGYYAIQPFEFVINGDSLSTEQQFVYVNTVPVNLEDGMKPIKGIYNEPFDWKGFLKKWVPIALAIIAGGLLIFFLVRRYYKNKGTVVKEVVVIKEPAHIIAYRSLNDLKTKNLLEAGKEKMYQSELTAILRTYLEDRYEIQAMEQTTGETIKNLQFSSLSPKLKENLVQVLNMADVVKFAKGHLSQQLNEGAFLKVKEFVDETKISENVKIESIE